eukprot:CAMPEP_0119054092 /NCGR_PEP_ID=MMETSP1177-20130426/74845_1 /TAXON_ID=2985 /ORGANISM="Ochromonas sp, Strain CCMP1899" /LENGTH=33 /DNA_ID= /DNA_START= /DNA_END= /DNA_ORIENTATION=
MAKNGLAGHYGQGWPGRGRPVTTAKDGLAVRGV